MSVTENGEFGDRPGTGTRRGLLIAAALLMAVGVASATIVLLRESPAAFNSGAFSSDEGGRAAPQLARPVGVFYDLPEIMVDIRGLKGRGGLLKLRLTLELDGNRDLARLESARTHLVDSYILFLRDMRPEDFEGEGLQRVRGELLARADALAAPVKVRTLLFREIMLQ